MREICTSGSMSGERKRDEGIMPALPRLSSTLLFPLPLCVERVGVGQGDSIQ